jgi:hypothetical protein
VLPLRVVNDARHAFLDFGGEGFELGLAAIVSALREKNSKASTR